MPIGLMVIVGVISLLLIVAVYRLVTQRMQLSSGRNIGRFFPKKEDGKYVFDNLITITTRGKWCRLLLTLESAEASKIRHSPKYFFEKVVLLVGTPFTLILRDNKKQVVYTETRTLEPFVTWLESRLSKTGTMLSERSMGRHWGTFTLLEFLPQKAGQYYISLEITEKVAAGNPRSSSTWEVLEVELSVMEDVIPLSETVSYPHRRVQI